MKRKTGREYLAQNLKHFRQVLGWSQEYLALEAGLHRTFVAHVERCARNISLDNIDKLAIALRKPTYELLVDPGPH
ncbi:MAG: helix-turn-helix transcriptional regulator [Sterolibacterium sp.]